ncbi:MAG: hypothetical protein ACP5GF_13935, partial [Thiomonas sp.]
RRCAHFRSSPAPCAAARTTRSASRSRPCCGNGSASIRAAHSRTKPTLIYRKTKNLRAVQLLLGHTKLESTVRYLGIEVEDALDIAEQMEI